ncbi:PREDICTED: WD repeat-containing protein 6 [Eufriesea mexicana]|uniref:WD repeat-containing protein 6 n=1 Tax=Eufriesea mexicana TaxID=516756 RepID=UPI00083C462C|nr:PREDICTED: WD repeat-containing protein 6 [Eufriesea mexicana]
MFSKLLCTDVLAVRCIDNLIFIAMGCTLYIFNVDTYKFERKINCLYPYNIHGIIEGPDNKLTVFGAHFFCTYNIYHKQGTLIIKEDCNKNVLNDWIIAAKWLTFEKCNYLCVLLAHNNICIYNVLGKYYQSTWCEERCILYGGSILNNNNKNLIIFSGTVYQEILIWEVNYMYHAETASVLHRLQGHNGVIFSVIYDPATQLICSTSDDRTVRLWKVSNGKNNDGNLINWKEVNIKLMRTMFGHTARVWKSIIRNKVLITIGEDSLICNWSLDGKLLKKVCAHHGAAIWSIDISDDNKSIFTGGADGAVHAWPFVNNYIQETVVMPKICAYASPKYVSYLSSGNYIIFNEDGTLLMFDRCHNNQQETLYLQKYSTYCVMEVSLCHSYICFASRDGYITIYKEVAANIKLDQILEEKIMESQILSVQWLENNKLVICGINGVLKIFNFTVTGSIILQSVCILPYSRERWLTAAVLYEGLLVCGDRAGNMYVFEYEKFIPCNEKSVSGMDLMKQKPIQTFVKVHGKIGIQNFIILNSKLISAGRDRMLKFYELSKHENTKLLNTLHQQKMPMDWISGHLKLSEDILVLGFKEVEFTIYSMFHHRILMRVPCGGGHRSWDCMLLNEFITFLYIRNKQVYISDFPLYSFTSPILLNGFHTKEIYCINPILKVDQYNAFISGSEDGTIRISYISNILMKNNYTFQTLSIFNGHISSVRFLTCLNLQSDTLYNKYLIFSGGGRAQIKVWEIDIKISKTFLQSTDISCHDITSHMLYGFDRHRKKQWQKCNSFYNIQPETRYMDVKIYRCNTNLNYVVLFVACADGFVRIFLYDINIKSVSLKAHAKCVDRCITKITVLTYDEKIIVLIMSTDGIARFIDFTDTVSIIIKFPQTKEEGSQNCKSISIAKFNLHQSGINSYDIKIIGKDEYLLATGGDDNLFNLVHFKIQLLSKEKELYISLLSKWNTSTAHVAQITGIIFHEKNTIFSVGMDQQVIMYRYDCNNNLSVRILKRIYTFVTDVKGLTSWYNSKDESFICVYGKGFEILVT